MSPGGLFLDSKQLKHRVRSANLSWDKHAKKLLVWYQPNFRCCVLSYFKQWQNNFLSWLIKLGLRLVSKLGLLTVYDAPLQTQHLRGYCGVNSSGLWRQRDTEFPVSLRLRPASSHNLGDCKAGLSTPQPCRLWALSAAQLQAATWTGSTGVTDRRISGMVMLLPQASSQCGATWPVLPSCSCWAWLRSVLQHHHQRSTQEQGFAERLLLSLPSLTRSNPLGCVHLTWICTGSCSLCSDCNSGLGCDNSLDISLV